jgi:hypothetical protein
MTTYALLGAGVIVVVLGLALWLGMRAAKASGRAEAHEEQERANADAFEKADTIEDRVRAAGADVARDGLRDYARRRAGHGLPGAGLGASDRS